MGKTYDAIDDRLRGFLERQPVFFVATAPLAAEGHVNLSPKGLDTFRVLGPRSVAWLDLGGSGVETIAHLRENGRIVLMFCAFEGPPRIVRLHGRGEAILPGHVEFDALAKQLPARDAVRSVVRIAVERIADSCGYGVPRMTFDAERTQLPEWVARKTPEELAEYRRRNNAESLDGLPGIDAAPPRAAAAGVPERR